MPLMLVIDLHFPLVALAQDEPVSKDGMIEEIIVTARRREERLQDVPEAVTVFTADLIEKAGIVSFQDFADMTPNFSFFERYRPGSVVMVMRGKPKIQAHSGLFGSKPKNWQECDPKKSASFLGIQIYRY